MINKTVRKWLSTVIVLALYISCMPTGTAMAASSKAKQYDADAAVAYADKHWDSKEQDYDVSGKGATFVRKCMAAGGVKWSKKPSTPGDLIEYLVDKDYAVAYENNDIDFESIKKGDAVAVLCDNHSSLWGLQILFVSEGYDSQTGCIAVDSKNVARHNVQMSASALDKFADTTKCALCSSTKNNYLIHVSMNTPTNNDAADAPTVEPTALPASLVDGDSSLQPYIDYYRNGESDKSSCELSDYPEFKKFLESYVFTEPESTLSLCGVLVDLSHDGYPELVVVEISEKDRYSGTYPSDPMFIHVYMLINGRVELCYSNSNNAYGADYRDFLLINYNGYWYLIVQQDESYGLMWKDWYCVFYFNEKGVQQIFEEHSGADDDSKTDSQNEKTKNSFYRALNRLLSIRVNVCGSIHFYGCDFGMLISRDSSGTASTENSSGGFQSNITVYRSDFVGELHDLADYAGFAEAIANYTYPPYTFVADSVLEDNLLCGALVDLSHDGEPELVTVRLSEDDYCAADAPTDELSSRASGVLFLDVYMLVNGTVKTVFSASVNASHSEQQDYHLVYYNNQWYLLERSANAGTGLWWDVFTVFYFSKSGKTVYLEESHGLEGTIEGEENPYQPDEASSKAYSKALNSYLADSIVVAGCVTVRGCDLPLLFASESPPTMPEEYDAPAANGQNIYEAEEISSGKGYQIIRGLDDGPSGPSASSELTAEGTYFAAKKAFDYDIKTSWQEAADGVGIGEELYLQFGGPLVVDMIYVRPGYAKDSGTFKSNGRPKSILVTFLGETGTYTCRLSLSDENRDFYFEIPDGIDHECFSVTFTIEDVYAGLYYEDLAISEIQLGQAF